MAPSEELPYIEQLRSEEHRRGRATVELGKLLEEEELRIRCLHPQDPGRIRRIPVASAPVIELEDPRRYLAGDELLLVTGLGLPDDPAGMDRYVSRLRQGGVAGLLFGVMPVHDEVPAALTAACRAHDLPLLALPEDVPFIRLTVALTSWLESERVAQAAAVSRSAVSMVTSAFSSRPVRQILGQLAEATGTGVQLRGRRLIEQAGALPPGVGEEQLERAARPDAGRERLRFTALSEGPSARSHDAPPGASPEAVRLRLRGRGSTAAASTVILVVAARPLTQHDLTLLMLAGDLLELILRAPGRRSAAIDQLTMRLILQHGRATTGLTDTAPDGARRSPGAVERTAEESAELLREVLGVGADGCAHAVVAMPRTAPPDARHEAEDRAEGSAGKGPAPVALDAPEELAWWSHLVAAELADRDGPWLRALVSTPPSRRRLRLCEDQGWVVAVSRARPVGQLGVAMDEAVALVPVAQSRGASVTATEFMDEPSEESALGRWAAAMPQEAREALAARMLGPLESLDERRRRECLDVLHCWLLHHGRWDGAARELGLHRNTVRRVIGTAARLLPVDFDDARHRADLLAALDILGRGRDGSDPRS
ncbi:PucR family transcriptional regulator [Nesterenkonia suensis]